MWALAASSLFLLPLHTQPFFCQHSSHLERPDVRRNDLRSLFFPFRVEGLNSVETLPPSYGFPAFNRPEIRSPDRLFPPLFFPHLPRRDKQFARGFAVFLFFFIKTTITSMRTCISLVPVSPDCFERRPRDPSFPDAILF